MPTTSETVLLAAVAILLLASTITFLVLYIVSRRQLSTTRA